MSTRKSLRISFVMRYSELALQMISTVILARILTPEEIGIFSVTVALVGFAHVLRDFGVGEYIIQEKELTPDRIRSALGLTMLFAWTLALLMVICAEPIARFYGHEGVRQVFYVFAANFFLIPFGSIAMVYLRRELRFDAMLRITLASAFAQPIVSVACAYQGMGYMSLAWGAFAGVVTTVVMTMILHPKEVPYLPGFKEIKRVISFGSWSSGNALSNYASKALPEAILGKLADMYSVGIFSRAMGTVEMFDRLITMAIWPVLMPYFAKEARTQGEIKQPYLYALDCYLGLAWPFFLVMAVLAYPLIRLLYGAQWDATVPVAQVMCMGAIVGSMVAFSGEALKATGQIKAVTKISVVMALLRAAAVIVMAAFGLIAVACTLAAMAIVRVVLVHRLLDRHQAIRWVDYSPIFGRSVVVSLCATIVPLMALLYFGENPRSILPLLVIGGAGAAGGWWLGLKMVKHPIKDELLDALKQYRDKRN